MSDAPAPAGGPADPEMPDDSDAGLDALAEAYEAGLAAERRGDAEAAADAFRRCLALDPDDRGGVSVRLAAMGAGAVPERAPPAYVATLFDQHADSFEMTLVHSLGYAIPDAIAEALETRGLVPDAGFRHALDLGCGTGLVAEALEGLVQAIDGIDLAEEMVALAHDKELYAALYTGDAEAFCRAAPAGAYDLVVAADVLPYLGVVEGLFAAVAAALAPGGLFAFSTETLAEARFAGAAFAVGPGHRFAHRPAAVAAALAAAGFETLALEDAVIRHEVGRPVAGHLVLARRLPPAGRAG